MYCLILINGDFEDGPAVHAALTAFYEAQERLVVVADGGLRHAAMLKLHPDVIVGDMDSADPMALREAEAAGSVILRHPAEKDETDFELALAVAAERGATTIRVIGALGGRLDQTISNLYLLALPALKACDVRIVSGAQAVWLAYPGQIVVRGALGDTLSLIPVSGDAEGIVTANLAYPLRGESLRFGPARGVSNVFTASSAHITFERGILLIVHTTGKA